MGWEKEVFGEEGEAQLKGTRGDSGVLGVPGDMLDGLLWFRVAGVQGGRQERRGSVFSIP